MARTILSVKQIFLYIFSDDPVINKLAYIYLQCYGIDKRGSTRGSQGSKGIRQWLINWCIFSMMLHKITLSVDYNFKCLKLLYTQITEPTNLNSSKVPKVGESTKNKMLL